MKQKMILLTLVIFLTIVSSTSHSLGMGKIQVYSALNESLRSTIDLLVNTDEELMNLEVKLASNEDYQKVGLDKSFVPSNIIVAFDEENPNQINVTSNGPISEPIVSILLDVNWNNGRILREFTILLDPPVYEDSNVQVNNVVVEPVQNNVVEEAIEEPETTMSEDNLVDDTAAIEPRIYTNDDVVQYTENDDTEITSAVEPEVSYGAESAEVFVAGGDTLWSIANRNKVGDLSTQQMMMAIYNNNSNAFIDNNINQLIKGSKLNIPTIEEARNIGFNEAMAQVESHHQSWSPEQPDYSSYQTEAADDTSTTDTNSNLDYGVQLSGGENDASDSGQSNSDQGDAADAQAIEEDLYNKEAENTELKDRISELEGIVEQQQDAIEIDDDGLANLENQLANAENDLTEAADEVVAEVDDIWDEATSDVDPAEVLDTVDTEINSEGQVTEDLSLTVDSVEESLVDGEDNNDNQISEALDATSNEVDLDSSEVAEQEVQKPVVKVNKPKNDESFVDQSINWIMDNLMWVVVGLVGLVVLIFLPRMLRGGVDDDEDETSFLDDIKNNNIKREAQSEEDSTETKMNEPIGTEEIQPELNDADESDGLDVPKDEDDVLASLDKSIDFSDSVEGDAFSDQLNEAEDEITELSETGEFETSDEEEFDLEGFLNDEPDDSTDDGTVTKNHKETLESADLDDEFEEISFDDFDDLEDLEDLDTESKADTSSEDLAVNELEGTAVTEADESTDEFSFDDGDDFDFDLDDELNDLDLSDEESNESADESDEFADVLDISDEAPESFETVEEDEVNMDEEIDLGLEDLVDDGDTVQTKLDLAKAYIDMGDAEGAKNLLTEIQSEGNDEQVEQAKKLLDDM